MRFFDLHNEMMNNIRNEFRGSLAKAKEELVEAHQDCNDSLYDYRSGYMKGLNHALNLVALSQSVYRTRCEEAFADECFTGGGGNGRKFSFTICLNDYPLGGGTLPETAARLWRYAKAVVDFKGGQAAFYVNKTLVDEYKKDGAK